MWSKSRKTRSQFELDQQNKQKTNTNQQQSTKKQITEDEEPPLSQFEEFGESQSSGDSGTPASE